MRWNSVLSIDLISANRALCLWTLSSRMIYLQLLLTNQLNDCWIFSAARVVLVFEILHDDFETKPGINLVVLVYAFI